MIKDEAQSCAEHQHAAAIPAIWLQGGLRHGDGGAGHDLRLGRDKMQGHVEVAAAPKEGMAAQPLIFGPHPGAAQAGEERFATQNDALALGGRARDPALPMGDGLKRQLFMATKHGERRRAVSGPANIAARERLREREGHLECAALDLAGLHHIAMGNRGGLPKNVRRVDPVTGPAGEAPDLCVLRKLIKEIGPPLGAGCLDAVITHGATSTTVKLVALAVALCPISTRSASRRTWLSQCTGVAMGTGTPGAAMESR